MKFDNDYIYLLKKTLKKLLIIIVLSLILFIKLIKFINIVIVRFKVVKNIVFDIALFCNLIYLYTFFCIQLIKKNNQRNVFF